MYMGPESEEIYAKANNEEMAYCIKDRRAAE
jgi:hypothetical protein